MPDPAETSPPLVFDWSQPRRPTARLLMWLLITSAGIAGFFFLFRVVYQTPRRAIPITNHITLLTPTDPEASALLQRVSDRDFFAFTNTSESLHSDILDQQLPRFHPLFEKHELRLQDLPQRDSKPPPVRLLDVTEPTLPPADLRELHAPPAATEAARASASPPHLALHLTGDLAKRKILSVPDFAPLASLDTMAWRFQIGVGPDGRVSFALPLTAAQEKPGEASQAEHLLEQLRFAAEPGSPAPSWGIATLHWQPSSPP